MISGWSQTAGTEEDQGRIFKGLLLRDRLFRLLV